MTTLTAPLHLSRLHLNERHRHTSRDLSSPYALHQTLRVLGKEMKSPTQTAYNDAQRMPSRSTYVTLVRFWQPNRRSTKRPTEARSGRCSMKSVRS